MDHRFRHLICSFQTDEMKNGFYTFNFLHTQLSLATYSASYALHYAHDSPTGSSDSTHVYTHLLTHSQSRANQGLA